MQIQSIIVLLLCFQLLESNAQSNCPSGYEERNVKCDGKTVKKCVPVSLSCSKCWHVKYSDCQGNIETSIWGGSFDSYEECVRKAQDFQTNHSFLGNCPQAGSKYLIILLGEKVNLCTTINSVAVTDLKNKMISFLNRYKTEISNYSRYFSGKPYKPGAIVQEYESMLKQAGENVNKLENYLKNITEQNLSEIETAFNDIQQEETALQQTHKRYESFINGNNGTSGTDALDYKNLNNNSFFDNSKKSTDNKVSNDLVLPSTQSSVINNNTNYTNQTQAEEFSAGLLEGFRTNSEQRSRQYKELADLEMQKRDAENELKNKSKSTFEMLMKKESSKSFVPNEGYGYSRLLYNDSLVQLTFSLVRLDMKVCEYESTNKIRVPFAGYYYLATYEIINKRNKKIIIQGGISNGQQVKSKEHIWPTGETSNCFAFSSNNTYWDTFAYSWDFVLTDTKVSRSGKFWTEIPDEEPIWSLTYKVIK